jgi:hypothetical protein
VYTVQATYSPAVADVVMRQAEGGQLPRRDHAVLAIRQFRDHTIGRSRFPGIVSGFFDRHGVKRLGDAKITPSVAGGSMGGCH